MGYKDPLEQPKAMRRWYLKNKRKVLLAGRKWRKKNPERQMVLSAKHRAKKLGLPFSITHEDIFIPKRCPVFGMLLKRKPGKLCDASPSLDRIRPHRGYVQGNVRVICNKANSIKRNATAKEIFKVAKWLAKLEEKA